MKEAVNQLYQPEPPLSFAPMRTLEAQQLYPPEPPLSFPPTKKQLAEQLYPPEPPLSFPPLPQVGHSSGKATAPPPQPNAILASDGIDIHPAVQSEPQSSRDLRLNARAISRQDLPELRVGHAKSLRVMDLTQLYISVTMLLVVVGLVVYSVRRRPNDKSKKQTADRTVTFHDSYEPFLG